MIMATKPEEKIEYTLYLFFSPVQACLHNNCRWHVNKSHEKVLASEALYALRPTFDDAIFLGEALEKLDLENVLAEEYNPEYRDFLEKHIKGAVPYWNEERSKAYHASIKETAEKLRRLCEHNLGNDS